jgi:hypothetical protein
MSHPATGSGGGGRVKLIDAGTETEGEMDDDASQHQTSPELGQSSGKRKKKTPLSSTVS